MPGKILRIHVASGAPVERGQPLMVMEAMKMENEIKATQAGVMGQIKVTEGQAVETGEARTVLDRPQHPYSQLLKASVLPPDVPSEPGSRLKADPPLQHGASSHA